MAEQEPKHLSFLIPVYNQDVRPLVRDLHAQIMALDELLEFEIRVYEDGSQDREFLEQNRQIAALNGVVYVQREENLGRTKIRSLLAHHAHYRNILFFDGDVRLPEGYMQRLWPHIGKNRIVSGGMKLPGNAPSRAYYLDWKFGKAREEIPLEERRTRPYKAFGLNNSLFPKPLLGKVPLQSKHAGYGHEDTLFVLTALSRGIGIEVIQNPTLTPDLDTEDVFLEKQQQALDNLAKLEEKHEVLNTLYIVQLAKKIARLPIGRPIARLLHPVFRSLCRLSKSLFFLDSFKLLYLASIIRK